MRPVRTLVIAFAAAVVLAAFASVASAAAGPVSSVPPLPAPGGTVVNVSTEAQLQSAVSAIRSNTTIVIAPGTYNLSSTLYINGAFTNVGSKSFTYEMRLHASESMTHCATQKTVEVCFDTKARASAPLPDEEPPAE